jgi:hypothetical protein
MPSTVAALRKIAEPYKLVWIGDNVYGLLFKIVRGEEDEFPDARSVAYTEDSDDGLRIFYRPTALDLLSRDQIVGVLFHELGHVFELTYGEDVVRAVLAACGVRPSELEERRADQISAAVFGHPIRYDDDLVQTVGRGTYAVRPRGLG